MLTPDQTLPGIRPAGRRFVDPEGRHVLLHGINLVNKDPAVRYLGDESLQTFAAFREWGFNCVRLGVIWDGLEPEPGVYDEAYLAGLDRRVAWAREAGLAVYLDMHQDLYSVLYSDGAPAWATLSGGAPHVTGEVWSDSYFISPAVQNALDNFWANAPAPDGLGLQNHLGRCWALLATRYADEPTVIGYDLLNEPTPGAAAPAALERMFAAGAALLGAREPQEAEALAQQWLAPQGRARVLDLLRDPDAYAQIVDASLPVYAAFEREDLMPFYRRMAAALRPVAPQRALFLETSIGANMGATSVIEPVDAGPQVYAPHGYDLVTDTESLAQASAERIAFIFRRHAETAARLEMPLLVGEWGAYSRAAGTLGVARDVVREFELHLCSETYWNYQPDIETFPVFRALHRPYPERIAGTLTGYRYDPDADTFTCTWHETGCDAPTQIYMPDWVWRGGRRVTLEPAGHFTATPITRGSGNTVLSVPPLGSATERRLTIDASS
jgi:endoglycosylceramidase